MKNHTEFIQVRIMLWTSTVEFIIRLIIAIYERKKAKIRANKKKNLSGKLTLRNGFEKYYTYILIYIYCMQHHR